MRYNDNYATASASVEAPKSDVAIQRDYLLNRLNRAESPKDCQLGELFNLHVDNTPKSYKQMIEMIKGGKYTIDKYIAKQIEMAEEVGEPYYGGCTHGIIWDGPQPDRDGYYAARGEMKKQVTATKDIIMVSDAAAGLAALQAFEAWLPTPAVTSTTASAN